MLFCEPIHYLKSPIICIRLVLTLDWVCWKDELDKTWLVITRQQYAQNDCTILSIFKMSFTVEVSPWFLFCSGQVFRGPVFETTSGALLRPKKPSLFKMMSSPRTQGTPNSPHPQLHRFRFVWLHAIRK